MDNFINSVYENHIRDIIKKQDEIIRNAMISKGIDINDLKNLETRITRVQRDGDDFEHYYYDFGLSTEIRIISIEKAPKINMFEPYKFSITTHYY